RVFATANKAASAAPCQTKWSSVQPSASSHSGEIPCARVVIGFSSRTRPEGGAAPPALFWRFAGLRGHESSIRWLSLQIPAAERHLRAGVWFPWRADKLHRRARAGLSLGAPCPWRS